MLIQSTDLPLIRNYNKFIIWLMGCGASAGDKTALQTVPLSKGENNTPEASSATKKQTSNIPEKVINSSDKKTLLQTDKDKKDLKASLNKDQPKPKTDSKNTLLNSATDIRASAQKRNDSVPKNSSEVKAKNIDLRGSSLGKSQSGSKIQSESSPTKKNGNPQELAKLKMTESVIDQENEEVQLKATQTKEKEKIVKKTKSIKNNKELTDLIKIYGL